jgi:hypothetical protein
MRWARYGPDKKQISALQYNQSKHGEVYCRFCNGKMIYVGGGGRAPHFRVADRKSHTCKYFGNDIEELVATCSNAVKLNRQINESPLFTLQLDPLINPVEDQPASGDYVPQELSVAAFYMKGSDKEKSVFKFIHDLHDKYLKNEYENVLRFRFIVNEAGQKKRVKAEDLIPSYKQVLRLVSSNKLGERKRFVVGSILSAKETPRKNIEVTLRGEKIPEGYYINHKVIFMNHALQQLNLQLSDFYRGRSIVVYGKLKLSDTKREIVSFVSQKEDFDFVRYTSLDGDWLDSQEKKKIDDFFYMRNLAHVVPGDKLAKHFFEFEGRVHMPDWIVFLRDKTLVVDYTNSPNDYLSGRLELRRDYFINHTPYIYLSIFKEDLEDNYKGLKQKLHEIQPGLQLNFFEF